MTTSTIAPLDQRQQLAQRIFRAALLTNAALTAFVALSYFTGLGRSFAGEIKFDSRSTTNILFGALFLNIGLGFIWWGIKSLLLRYVVGLDQQERRAVFASRMDRPFAGPVRRGVRVDLGLVHDLRHVRRNRWSHLRQTEDPGHRRRRRE